MIFEVMVCISVKDEQTFNFFLLIDLNANHNIQLYVNAERLNITLLDFFFNKFQNLIELFCRLQRQYESFNF